MSDFLLLLLAVTPVILGIVAVGLYLERRRRKFWAGQADRLGMRFTPGDPSRLRDSLPGFSLFRKGRRPTVDNTMVGDRRGRPLTIFDYQYTTGSGKSQTHHRRTALVAPLPAPSPGLVIRPEGFGDRIAALFGFDDIDFEHDEFSRAFHVSGANEGFARVVCHPVMIEHLLSDRKFCWELLEGHVLLHSDSLGRFDQAELDRALALLDGFLDRLPADLVRRS